MTDLLTDEHWMQLALEQAEQAAERGEVPVGAVLVRDNQLIAAAGNAQITSADPTAHAEVLALRAAAQTEQNYRLPGTTLYVTLEPCTMCCGAMVHARVERVVFATREPKAGAVVSTASALENPSLNHVVAWGEGVLGEHSSQMLSAFFKARREQRRAEKLHDKGNVAESSESSESPESPESQKS